MAGELSIGTLTVNVTANTSGLQTELKKAADEAKRSANILQSQFNAAGGAIGSLGEMFGRVGSSINKMFGKEATTGMAAFGASIGLTEQKALGLKAGLETAEGAIRLVGLALQPTTLMLAGAAVGVGALAIAWDSFGQQSKQSNSGWRDTLREWLDLWLTSMEESLRTVRLWGESVLGTFDRVAASMRKIPGMGLNASAVEGVAGLGRSALGSIGDAESTLGAMRQNNINGGLLPVLGASMGRDLDAAKGFVVDPVVASAKRFAEMLSGMFGDLGKFFTKKPIETAKKSMDDYWKLYLDTIDFAMKQEQEKQKKIREANERINQAQIETAEQEIADDKKIADALRRHADDVAAATQKATEAVNARWSALGSGQIGTAAGVGGVGGAALNIVGGAAAMGENTGTVLQGAAQGGQAGGVWGAIIGAIVALATKTSSFSSMLGGIEKLLGMLIPILDSLLAPLAASFQKVMDVLSPILEIVGDLVGFLSGLMDGMSGAVRVLRGILDMLKPILNALSGVTDALGGAGGFMDEKIGKGQDGTGGTSVNDVMDWATLSNVFSGIGNVLEGKDFTHGGYDAKQLAAISAAEESFKTLSEATRQWAIKGGTDAELQSIRAAEQVRADMERQAKLNAEAKQKEIDAANKAAVALERLADSVLNSAPGYKLAAVMYSAQDRAGGLGGGGSPFGGG